MLSFSRVPKEGQDSGKSVETVVPHLQIGATRIRESTYPPKIDVYNAPLLLRLINSLGTC